MASELMAVVLLSSLPWPRKRGTRPKLRRRPRYLGEVEALGRFSTTTGRDHNNGCLGKRCKIFHKRENPGVQGRAPGGRPRQGQEVCKTKDRSQEDCRQYHDG